MIELHGMAVGDRVTVSYQKHNYESVVHDIPAPDTIVIAHPSHQGIFLRIEDRDTAEVTYIKDNGIMTFRAMQGQRKVVNTVALLALKAVSEVVRKQRRSYYRLEKSIPVQVSVKKNDKDEKPKVYRGQAVNISGAGIKLAIRQPLDQDRQVECKIMLTPDIKVVLDGQVVWTGKSDTDQTTNLAGIQFTIEDEMVQRTLVRYITIEQRKKLKTDR